MNRAAKRRRAEHRSIKLLEQQGYTCVRSAASKGPFDVIAIGTDVLLMQVKVGRWPSIEELEAMKAVPAPPAVRKLVHRWRPRQAVPDVREL